MREFVDLLDEWPPESQLSYNVAPTTQIPIITKSGLALARWGMVPSWADEFKTKYATFNARLESVKESKLFAPAWKSARTCLIPAAGYYEWRDELGAKQPYYVHAPDSGLIVFAGLWEPWQDRMSCTVITMESSGNITDLHIRMPLMLTSELAKTWLNEGPVIDPFASTVCQSVAFHPVSRAVNSSRASGPDLIQPIKL
jgi:putative SOS response-associated peptidase YedK